MAQNPYYAVYTGSHNQWDNSEYSRSGDASGADHYDEAASPEGALIQNNAEEMYVDNSDINPPQLDSNPPRGSSNTVVHHYPELPESAAFAPSWFSSHGTSVPQATPHSLNQLGQQQQLQHQQTNPNIHPVLNSTPQAQYSGGFDATFWTPHPSQQNQPGQYPASYGGHTPQNTAYIQVPASYSPVPTPAPRRLTPNQSAANTGMRNSFRSDMNPLSSQSQSPSANALLHARLYQQPGSVREHAFESPYAQYSGPLQHGRQTPGQLGMSPASPHFPQGLPQASSPAPLLNGAFPGPQSSVPQYTGFQALGQPQSSDLTGGTPSFEQVAERSTAVAPQAQFDPSKDGAYQQVPGIPNLYFSDDPIEVNNAKINSEKSFPSVLGFNAKDAPIFPNRKGRLPGEIQRDLEWLAKQKKDVAPEEVAEIQAIDLQMAMLKKELGPNSRLFAKDSRKKSSSTRKGKATSDASDDSSDDNSDSEEDEESKEDQEALKITMALRPSEPLKAAEFDVVQIVWQDPKSPVTRATATIIDSFGVYIGNLWNEGKELRKELKAVKEKPGKKLESLLAKHKAQMNVIGAALEAALRYAGEVPLENMGGNAKMVIILTNALKFSLSFKDYNGGFPKAILRLMSRFKTMDKVFVRDVLKLSDTLRKYLKLMDKENVGYFDEIMANARDPVEPEKKGKEATSAIGIKDGMKGATNIPKKAPAIMAKDLMSASKKPVSAGAKKIQSTGTTTTEARKVSNGNTAAAVSGSSSKRPRDEDVDSRASKKVAVETFSSTAGTTKSTATTAAKSVPTTTTKTTTITQPRPKATGSILPGRTARPVSKPAPKKAETQQSSSTKISGLLAEIARPKTPPKQREEPARAPETEEEKKRRLRKEARRSLRVHWKPDDELEQVQEFTREDGEDEGRADNMIRDARDDRSEGQAFVKTVKLQEERQKQKHKGGNVGGEEEDEEDDNDQLRDINLRESRELSVTDLTGLDESRRGNNFITRGGSQTFHTDDQKNMEEYEKQRLIAVYTSSADIPPTPKSPPRKEAEKSYLLPKVAHLPTDDPKFQQGQLRRAEAAQFGFEVANHRMLQKLRDSATPDRASQFDKAINSLRDASGSSHRAQPTQSYSFAPNLSQSPHNASRTSSTPFSSMSRAERDAEVFRVLSSDVFKRWQDPNPVDVNNPKTQRRYDYDNPKVQADIDAFENVAAAFAGKPYPAHEPPEHLKSNPDHVKEWQTGHNKDMAAKATKDAVDRAKKLAEGYSRQSVPTEQLLPQSSAAPAAHDEHAAAWAAWFAQNQAHVQPYAQAQPQQSQPQAQAQVQSSSYDQSIATIIQKTQAIQAQQAQQAQQSTYGAYSQPSQQQQPQPAAQDSNTQIQALLAALGGQTSQQQAAAPAPQPSAQSAQDANTAAWFAYYASIGQGQAGYQQPQQQPYLQHDQDRGAHSSSFGGDVMLDYGSSGLDSRDNHQRDRKDKENYRDRRPDNKGINRSLIGTKPCLFWAKGQCAKGDQCTFRHDPNDLN